MVTNAAGLHSRRDPGPPPTVHRSHCRHCGVPIWRCYPVAHDWAWHGYDWPRDRCDAALTERDSVTFVSHVSILALTPTDET